MYPTENCICGFRINVNILLQNLKFGQTTGEISVAHKLFAFVFSCISTVNMTDTMA